MTKNILETERLVLREFTLADAEFVVALLNERDFLRFIGDKKVRNAADAGSYLRDGPMASYRDNGFGLYHVARKETATAIGMCGILKRPDQCYPDIGYAFLASQAAKGFAVEAARATLEYGQRHLGLPIIDAFVNPQNERSIRLLEKLGLNCIGGVRMQGVVDEQVHYRIEVPA